MVSESPNPYDEVPYPTFAQSRTHPDRLATLATLFGMNPAPIESCRVLELGCGDGGNLIPMAQSLPGGEFVGVDSAGTPVARGREIIEELGLANIRLLQADLMDAPDDLGRFDFIVADALYSSVPPEVQEAIFSLCRRRMSAGGVAFLSYSTRPGDCMRDMLREMMRFHTAGCTGAEQRIYQARAFVRFLAESQTGPESDPYRMFLLRELERITHTVDGAFYHIDLGVSRSVYFHQFLDQAGRHGLKFLAEAEGWETDYFGLPEGTREKLNLLGEDVVARQQYLDFLRCRTSRRTLLVHQEAVLDRNPRSRIERLFFALPAAAAVGFEPAAPPEWTLPAPLSPAAEALVRCLEETRPGRLDFEELFARAGWDDREAFGDVLFDACATGRIEWHIRRSSCASAPGERPVAGPLARIEARKGPIVTSLDHVALELEMPILRRLLPLLDGSRDRDALVEELNRSPAPAGEGSAREPVTADDLERTLAELARMALLQG